MLKKSGVDESVASNYRPVCNLTFLSKLLERVVHRQTIDYLLKHKLLPEFQSAYTRGHSTETAVLKIVSDIIDEIAKGHLVLLSLLDHLTAFDMVDHSILSKLLESSFRVKDVSLRWFDSYLVDRSQSVYLVGVSSTPRILVCGVPQGAVLGPLLFTLYSGDIGHIVRVHGLIRHCCSDATQLYFFCKPPEAAALEARVIRCLGDIAEWMLSNRLKLNQVTSEFLWCATARHLHLVDCSQFQLADGVVTTTVCVRNLGAHLDASINMSTHIGHVISLF